MLTDEERDILILRLANELEDHLDLAMCYCHEFRRQIDESYHLLSGMADFLGFRTLAEAFVAIGDEVRAAGWTAALSTGRKASYSAYPQDAISMKSILERLRLS